jgi:uncharacterized phosphosugar-binding protein
MSMKSWFEHCDEVLAKIRTTQADAIGRAAERIAEAAANGGGLHIYDTGHCSQEPIHRAGGLCMLRPFTFSLPIESAPAPARREAVSQRLQQTRQTDDEALADLAVARSSLAPGDVLIANSVSGKTAQAVQVALAARRLGAVVVAITNVTYSSSVESQHSSAKHLYEVADVVIDNCGVVGDAVLDMEGLDTKAAPTSGVTFCYIIWALVAETIARMAARGLKPHVYRSINQPGGEEYNARAEAEYRETGV